MELNTEDIHIAKSKEAFVTRLFQGDVPLPITYWVFNVLVGNFSLHVILTIIESKYIEITSSKFGPFALQIFNIFVICYSVFMLVAIWRSARKYQGKAIWSTLARIAVVLGALTLIGNLVLRFEQRNNLELALIQEIEIVNKSLPKLIDEDTRLDHVLVQKKEVYYNYTLINWLSTDLDVQKFITIMTSRLKTTQCNDNAARKSMNEDIVFVYMYRDKSGNPVAKIVVDKSDCL